MSGMTTHGSARHVFEVMGMVKKKNPVRPQGMGAGKKNVIYVL